MDNAQTQTQPQISVTNKLEMLLQQKPIILQLLRFAAIGVLNTALDFIILNVVSKSFGITSGLRLGQINIIGFSAAVIQSYFWNRHWAFGQQMASLWQNFVRLVLVGALGAVAVLMVLFGSNYSAPASFYIISLAIFLAVEFIFWFSFGLNKVQPANQAGREFLVFLIVSLVGLVVNSLLLATVSNSLHATGNADLNKNLAKIAATLISLVWNFVGYKLFVFKK